MLSYANGFSCAAFYDRTTALQGTTFYPNSIRDGLTFRSLARI
ncbi:unnamed protein product [Larinioides sclopetarius]|uniref:Uncharacterized protein n=1 Tax=Larinioides sclopetarius TaxID=280406 RepID=A0AAV2B745_9ARAC